MKTLTVVAIVAIVAATASLATFALVSNPAYADREQGQCNKSINREAAEIGIHGPLINNFRKAVCNS